MQNMQEFGNSQQGGEDLVTRSPASPIKLHEANFVAFPGHRQSNIYGLCSLRISGSSKLLVATLRGQIFCLEFHKNPLRPPLFYPINFSYIPGDAEVISIDAFVKEPKGLIFGVTLIKRDSEPKEIFFNLYGIHCDPNEPFQWEKIAEDWQPLNLKFIPFQLTHTQIFADDKWETVFLLAGDDLKVHLYREECLSELSFQEEPSNGWFPELQDLPSSVTYMDIKLVGFQRITSLGCQTGYLQCALVDLTSNNMLKCWSTKMIDGPITSVKFFTCKSGVQTSESIDDYHLLVGSAIELGAVFLNVLENGFSRPLFLPQSHLHDSVLCAEVADVNWDGRKELILGTYGKEVLVYRLHETGGVPSAPDSHSCSQFELTWQRNFAHPIHQVWYGDLTHDGLSELAVVSMGGVHILQHDLKQASATCVQRLLSKMQENRNSSCSPAQDDQQNRSSSCSPAQDDQHQQNRNSSCSPAQDDQQTNETTDDT